MQQIGKALVEMGLSNTPNPPRSESKEEMFKCVRCRDAELLHPLKEDGQVDYSTSVLCRYCASTERIRKHLGVSSMDSTFDNFKAVPGTEDAFKAAKLLSTLNTDWRLLLIYGTWGNGKTHLLEAIAITLWDRGIWVRVNTFPEFMGRLKGTFDRTKDSPETTFNDIMDQYCTTPYLLLDDVGAAGSFTPFSLSQLERIMLARYRDNLLTVITTNLDEKEIPKFVISRFSDAEKGRMVLNEAKDYRPTNKANGKVVIL